MNFGNSPIEVRLLNFSCGIDSFIVETVLMDDLIPIIVMAKVRFDTAM